MGATQLTKNESKRQFVCLYVVCMCVSMCKVLYFQKIKHQRISTLDTGNFTIRRNVEGNNHSEEHDHFRAKLATLEMSKNHNVVDLEISKE